MTIKQLNHIVLKTGTLLEHLFGVLKGIIRILVSIVELFVRESLPREGKSVFYLYISFLVIIWQHWLGILHLASVICIRVCQSVICLLSYDINILSLWLLGCFKILNFDVQIVDCYRILCCIIGVVVYLEIEIRLLVEPLYCIHHGYKNQSRSQSIC